MVFVKNCSLLLSRGFGRIRSPVISSPLSSAYHHTRDLQILFAKPATCRPATPCRALFSTAPRGTDNPVSTEKDGAAEPTSNANIVEPSPSIKNPGPSGQDSAPAWLKWLDNNFLEITLKNFGKTFSQERALQGHEAEVLERIQGEYHRLLEENRDAVVDDRSRYHLMQASMLLAAYRHVLPWMGNNAHATKELLRVPLGDGSSFITRFLVRWRLMWASDVLETAAATARTLGIDFGRSFDVEHDTRRSEDGKPTSHVTRVNRCFYHTFFTRHDVPELTSLFCAWDRVFFDPIDPTRMGVRFDRPQTLADGSPHCSFEFHRVPPAD